MIRIFKYLEEKKGRKIPLNYKILYSQLINDDELIFNGNLDFYNFNIEYLPDNLIINGNLNLSYSKIKLLPNKLVVNGWLNIMSTDIYELPVDLIVKESILCYSTPLSTNIKNNISLLNFYKKNITKYIFFD